MAWSTAAMLHLLLFLSNKKYKQRQSSVFSITKIPDTLDIYGYIDYTSVKYQGISTDYPHLGQNVFRWSWSLLFHEVFYGYRRSLLLFRRAIGSFTTISEAFPFDWGEMSPVCMINSFLALISSVRPKFTADHVRKKKFWPNALQFLQPKFGQSLHNFCCINLPNR
jgi:hypothetical protein